MLDDVVDSTLHSQQQTFSTNPVVWREEGGGLFVVTGTNALFDVPL